MLTAWRGCSTAEYGGPWALLPVASTGAGRLMCGSAGGGTVNVVSGGAVLVAASGVLLSFRCDNNMLPVIPVVEGTVPYMSNRSRCCAISGPNCSDTSWLDEAGRDNN